MQYRNISISGQACTGTTTLAQNLARTLGWRCYFSGRRIREAVKSKGLDVAHQPDRADVLRVHQSVDANMLEIMNTESRHIFEGWLTGWLGRNTEGLLRVLVIARKEVQIERLRVREKMSEEAAREHIASRLANDMRNWRHLYQADDFWNKKYYHLVIDTSDNTIEQTVNAVLGKLT